MTSAPIVELREVTKTYGTEQNPLEVLHGLDLTVERGEYVAIVGPSGSGKSTLLNLLGCLDRPSSGQVLFSGQGVGDLNDRALSRLRNDRIGFVFQSFQLISHLTVQENVELPLFYARVGRRERRARAAALIDQVGLGHRPDHVPSELSGGERQRVAIARALANEPDLLLADEPTGNLDSQISEEILALFDGLHQSGRTIVMITHDDGIAAEAPRRVRILDGRIVEDQRSPNPTADPIVDSIADPPEPTP